MLKKGEHIERTPAELQVLLDKDTQTRFFLKAFPNPINKGIATGLDQQTGGYKKNKGRQSDNYAEQQTKNTKDLITGFGSYN